MNDHIANSKIWANCRQAHLGLKQPLTGKQKRLVQKGCSLFCISVLYAEHVLDTAAVSHASTRLVRKIAEKTVRQGQLT